MFALGFICPEDGTGSVEFITDDFGEAIDNLFDARNDAAAGLNHWAGSYLLILVLRDGKTSWEDLAESSRVE
jgi:hypothetical protein